MRPTASVLSACRLFATLLASGLLSSMPSLATGQTIPHGYELVAITSGNGLQERLPRLNNLGQVVFSARVPGSNTQSEIWMYDRATETLNRITDDDVYDALPDIADDGTMVWMRNIGPDMGAGPTPEIVLRTPDGLITRITDNSDIDWAPRINNRRQVAWHREMGVRACGGPVDDVFLFDYDSGNVTAITTNAVPEFLLNQGVAINDLGDIAWTEYDFCDPPPGYNFTSRIMVYSNGQSRELPAGGFGPQGARINNRTQVVWNTFDTVTHDYVLHLWDAGDVSVITQNGANGAINDDGVIAFNKWDYATERWNVWLWDGAAFKQITGDSRDHIVPDINRDAEAVWACGEISYVDLDICMLRRFETGDLNCDGSVNAFDIDPFVSALVDPEAYQSLYPECDSGLADVNGDTYVDGFDIEPFINRLIP